MLSLNLPALVIARLSFVVLVHVHVSLGGITSNDIEPDRRTTERIARVMLDLHVL